MEQKTVDLFKKLLKILEPPPDFTVATWADEHRMLSPEASASPGRWKTSQAPYQREIMEAISDNTIEKVVIMSAAQIGKTDALILNPIGYYMHHDPTSILVLQPTIQMAEAFSKERLTPMLRDTPVLRGKVKEKGRDSGNTILQKLYPGGHVTMVGANSTAGLASRPIRIVLADEIDRYPGSAGDEGDPLTLAEKRTTTFWNKKIVCVSTPTTKGGSRIETEFENSTQEEWNVPCPACETLTPLTWGNIIFNKEDLKEVLHLCPHCGTASEEQEWKESSQKGKFIAAKTGGKVRGFHLNALASGFVNWQDVVEKFLIANEEKKKGNIELLKSWTNLEMGELWEEDAVEIKTHTVYERREKYNCEVPSDVIILTAGIDTQDDRFEIEVVGWGLDKESWGIKYSIIYGDLNNTRIWTELSNVLTRTFTTADGRVLGLSCACMDSGGHFTNEVYKFCKARESQMLFAIKGKGGEGVPLLNRPSTSNVAKAKLVTLGVDIGKSLIYGRLALTEEGGGYCHFPKEEDRGYNEAYFAGLTAEKRVLKYKDGKKQHKWVLKSDGARNEPLDNRNYATAAMEIVSHLLVPLEDKPKASKKARGTRSKGVQ